jgi:endonuclease/exonuclease/phosphatase (EEP) superfamily protein YafD
MKNLAILTLNCQKAYHPDLNGFLEKIIHAQTYDFILLQEVTSSIVSTITTMTSSYKILNPFDSIIEQETGVCVLYKEKFVLTEPFLLSFAKINRKLSPGKWGFAGAVFAHEDEMYVIGSVHLQSGLNFRIRRKELHLVKHMLESYASQEKYSIIFGGDFNTGFPRELAVAKRIFSPLFKRVNKNLGPTLNSRYTERAPFILNKISVFLAKFGIGFTFRTDHFFVSSKIVKEDSISCTILPDRVSDHNPVELFISKK